MEGSRSEGTKTQGSYLRGMTPPGRYCRRVAEVLVVIMKSYWILMSMLSAFAPVESESCAWFGAPAPRRREVLVLCEAAGVRASGESIWKV